jgi:hypothetical protein
MEVLQYSFTPDAPESGISLRSTCYIRQARQLQNLGEENTSIFLSQVGVPLNSAMNPIIFLRVKRWQKYLMVKKRQN